MALPTAYLTSTKNLDGILSAIQTAQAPSRFTIKFLNDLGYKSNSDRLIINVLKAIGFLSADGAPTDRYYRYLDQTEAAKVLGEGVQEAYVELFQLNRNAHELGRSEIKNKLKTLTQGQHSESVLNKMASTFTELAKRASFSATGAPQRTTESVPAEAAGDDAAPTVDAAPQNGQPARPPVAGGIALGGLVYNIQIHLPESRDQAVYDALFRSLKSHLLQ
jgi:hypothetical protein